MQSSILVKPNLKLILLGALVIAVLHDLCTSGKSEASSFRHYHYRVTWLSDEELVKFVDEVDAAPNAAGYMIISEAYQKRGDMRRALHYVKKARASESLDEWED